MNLFSIALVAVIVKCEPPVDALYEFSGTLLSVRRDNTLSGGAANASPLPCLPSSEPNSSQCSWPKRLSVNGRLERALSDESIAPVSLRHKSIDGVEQKRRPSAFERIRHSIFSEKRHAFPGDIEILSGEYSLSLGQFMLRGTSLVNTAWVYGLVVYVSTDTRIFQNANAKVRSISMMCLLMAYSFNH